MGPGRVEGFQLECVHACRFLVSHFLTSNCKLKRKKNQHTHFKIPPKKPAVSLIIMEENLDGDVSARQGKEPIALNET